MRKAWRIWGWACLLALGFAPVALAQVQFGISADDKGVNSFYLSIGDYYKVPQQQVQVCVQRHIPDDEIPVAMFIAQRANVSPRAVIDFRLTGQPWLQVAFHFGLQPDVFYVPVKTSNLGPPYGKAYGYWRNKKFKKHKKHDDEDENQGQPQAQGLDDHDIVNLVNLKFISAHYGTTPDTIIKLRTNGQRFQDIDGQYWQKKHKHHDEGDEGGDEGNGHGKGHKKNKKWDEDNGRGNDQRGMDQDSDHGRGHGRDKEDDEDHHGRGHGDDN